MSVMEAKQDEQISESRKTNSLLEALRINRYKSRYSSTICSVQYLIINYQYANPLTDVCENHL